MMQEKNRLNLTKASSADLTGGYILDNEHNKTRPGQNETQFTLPRFGIDYILREPNKAALTQPMIDYIKVRPWAYTVERVVYILEHIYGHERCICLSDRRF